MWHYTSSFAVGLVSVVPDADGEPLLSGNVVDTIRPRVRTIHKARCLPVLSIEIKAVDPCR